MKSVLWEESRDIGDKWSNPWCIAGYFNVLWFPSERIRDVRFTPTMGEFLDLIDERHLIVLPLGEKFFPDLIIMRNPPDLDWYFLVSTDWEEQFEKSIQSILTQAVSNYCSIRLDCGALKRGKGPFNLKHVVQSWRISGISGKGEALGEDYQFDT